MTSNWERIDDDYRSWLTRYPCSEEEFNAFDFDQRTRLRQEYRSELHHHHQQQQQQQQQPDIVGLLQSELQGLKLEVHGVREALPIVLVGHVVTPSGASRVPQVVSTVFDALGLSLSPDDDGSEYSLPSECNGEEWSFSWKWPRGSKDTTDNKGLERQSYLPVLNFLRGLALYSEDVSEGQHCVENLLYNSDIYTRRTQNPTIPGQRVFLRHRVEGRTDIVALNRDHQGGYILRNMVKFAVEIKTVKGYSGSSSGCLREAQLQLIGLNAFNTNCSPPVVLTNLAGAHNVLYLEADQNWEYRIC